MTLSIKAIEKQFKHVIGQCVHESLKNQLDDKFNPTKQ